MSHQQTDVINKQIKPDLKQIKSQHPPGAQTHFVHVFLRFSEK